MISRFTDFHNSVNVPLECRQYLQYTMAGWSGFSGSPILLPDGRVIAVHKMATIQDLNQRVTHDFSHGIRIDCLWELLVYHHLEDKIRQKIDRALVHVDRWLRIDLVDRLGKAITLVDEASYLLSVEEKFTESVKKCNEAIKIAPDYALAYLVARSASTTTTWHMATRSAGSSRSSNCNLPRRTPRCSTGLIRPTPTATCNWPLSVENEVMVGATGAVVSMVTLSAAEATPVLPAASVAVAVRLWAPLASAAVV